MTLDRITEWIAYVGAVILVCTPIVFVLQKFAHEWLESAALTETKLDDKVARILVSLLDALAWIIAALPRVTMNLAKLRELSDQVRKIPRPPASLLPLVLVPLLAMNTACGGTQMSRARTVLAISGESVVAVERIFAPRYAEATDRAREESATFEEYAEAIRRWNVASTTILLAASALHVAEGSLDAIERGVEGDIPGVLACAGVALVDVMVALEGLVELPDALTTAIRMIGALAGPRCNPSPPEDLTTLGVPHASEALAIGGAP